MHTKGMKAMKAWRHGKRTQRNGKETAQVFAENQRSLPMCILCIRRNTWRQHHLQLHQVPITARSHQATVIGSIGATASSNLAAEEFWRVWTLK
jgi:hypothetical protein